MSFGFTELEQGVFTTRKVKLSVTTDKTNIKMFAATDKINVELSGKSDFRIDGKYTFEVGGKNKAEGQISGMQHAYLALDNIEFGHKNRIPLWLFGFLY